MVGVAVWPVLAIIAAALTELCVQAAGTATLFLVRTQAAAIGLTSHQLVSSGTGPLQVGGLAGPQGLESGTEVSDCGAPTPGGRHEPTAAPAGGAERG